MSILNNFAIKVCTMCETSQIVFITSPNECKSCEIEAHIIPYSNLQNVDQILDIISLALMDADFPVPELVYDIYENFRQTDIDENAARLIGQMFEDYMR